MAVDSFGRKLWLTKCECELLWMWFDVRRRLFSKIFWRINSSFCWACNRCCCKYIDECCCSCCCLIRWNWLIAGLIAGFGNWDEFQSNGFIRMFCSVKSFRWFWLRSKTKMKNKFFFQFLSSTQGPESGVRETKQVVPGALVRLANNWDLFERILPLFCCRAVWAAKHFMTKMFCNAFWIDSWFKVDFILLLLVGSCCSKIVEFGVDDFNSSIGSRQTLGFLSWIASCLLSKPELPVPKYRFVMLKCSPNGLTLVFKARPSCLYDKVLRKTV